MSTTKTENLENRPIVMVRTFKGQPAKLIAINWDQHLVEVANEKNSASIRVRASSVYKFAEDVYRKLETAFGRDDGKDLEKLWDMATPFA